MQRTWDGLEIASDNPTGATVVVRRTAPTGERQVLLLHRVARGPDYEGDWAWTSPAGARQPGESVYPAALRELAEEAGLDGFAPWAADLSMGWVLFAVDVPYDTAVTLVDPEHDRYEWVSLEQAGERVRPGFVAEQQRRAAEVTSAELAFRPMRDGDFAAVARWQATPHVAAWWDSRSRDEAAVRARYTPRLLGDDPTRMWVVEIDGTQAGFLQGYRLSDLPGSPLPASTADVAAVGFDYAIGEPSLVNRGLGTRMIWEFCRDVLHHDYPEATRFIASPSERNTASLRALAKCGFTRELRTDRPGELGEPPDTDVVCTLDVRHWLG